MVDLKTEEAIPYVNIWIKGSNFGTSTDGEGFFFLSAQKRDTILFSAVGYATKELPFSELQPKIKLQEVASYLQEVIVQPADEKLLIVNPFQSKRCNYLYGVGDTNQPWMVGTRIFYEEGMREASLISKIRFQTRSDVKSALMNIRLYSLDSAGYPSKFLIGENLLVEVKKGLKIHEIDLQDFHLRFSPSGIAVVAEWFILPRNRYEYKATFQGQKKRETRVSYEPAICTRVSEIGKNALIFQDGHWRLAEPTAGECREFKVELVLTNH